MATSRKDQLVRAAQFRASLTAFLNKAAIEEYIPRAKIAEGMKEKIEELGYKESTLDSFLQVMVKNKLLSAVRKEGQRGLLYGYGLPPADAEEPAKKAKVPKSTQVALTVDVIKSTGRVRLTLNGMVIEIGIVE